MAQNVAAIFFEPVFRSYGGEGPVEALRLSNEELKRQLAPQGGRTQVIFSMFVLSKNTHQNGPNKFLLWAFRSFEYLLVPVWVWGHPVAVQRGAKTWLTTCEICGSETRHCQEFEMKSVRVKPGPTQKVPWFKTPKSAMPCVEHVELLVDPLARSSDR